MRIKLTSVMVEDQAKAQKFYTEVLGFRTKMDVPVGEYRWITVTSPEGPDDLQLALEPNANPAARTFQEAMFGQGIPIAAFKLRGMRFERFDQTDQIGAILDADRSEQLFHERGHDGSSVNRIA